MLFAVSGNGSLQDMRSRGSYQEGGGGSGSKKTLSAGNLRTHSISESGKLYPIYEAVIWV